MRASTSDSGSNPPNGLRSFEILLTLFEETPGELCSPAIWLTSFDWMSATGGRHD